MSVTLNRVSRGDAAELIAANLANRDYHRPWVEPFTDQAGFEAWFADQMSGAQVSLVARTEAGELVGLFNISQIFMRGFRSAYLGYYGYRGAAGRGLMSQALIQVVRYAFDEIGLHRLEANVQPANARSLAMVERAGFKREGFSPRYLRVDGDWRDHERWAVLADDPELER
jgi:[ribosomal protein S5]-alanine N-acetyltransferase